MRDGVSQRDISRDIEIDLCRAWEDPNYVHAGDFTLQDTPRMRWHQQMAKAWQEADEGERISLKLEYQRVAALENQLIAAGINPALIGTDRDPRAHRRASEAQGLRFTSRAAGHDAPPDASMSRDDEYELQKRMVQSWTRRGRW
ncbi:MAG: hypothetical protein ACYC6N_18805 [Pirellulaceae bacterium]